MQKGTMASCGMAIDTIMYVYIDSFVNDMNILHHLPTIISPVLIVRDHTSTLYTLA